MDVVHKIGRRKTAVARVYLSEGKGNITVNKKDFKDYSKQKGRTLWPIYANFGRWIIGSCSWM